MNCEQTQTLLEEYFDGELEPRAGARLAAHLEDCAACAAAHADLAREQEFYTRAAPALTPSPDFWSHVAARARTDEGRHDAAGAGAAASPDGRVRGPAPDVGRREAAGEGGRAAEASASASADVKSGVPAVGGPRRGAGVWASLLRVRAFAALGAPRFSPALTAAAVLVAVALTAAVMKYLDARNAAPPPPSVARENHDAGKTPEALPADARQVAGNDDRPGSDAPSRTSHESPAERAAGAGPAAPSAPAAHEQRRNAASASSAAGASSFAKVSSAAGSASSAGAASAREGGARREPTADELVREAERKYVAAIALLSRDVRRRRPALDAESAARFEQTLATVDRAIAEARRASRRSPDDPLAAQYMLAAYARKVDVLREMASR